MRWCSSGSKARRCSKSCGDARGRFAATPPSSPASHQRLHEIAAPPSLPAAGPGDRLLHLDLHPDNVILSPSGPFVIDWTNARRGDPALDVALTWVIAATSGGPLERLFLRWFLPHFSRADLLRALPTAAERRVADVNVSDRERRAVRRFVERAVP
jgi:aminoglycoside phosphotransferase (APT) family kinase protein